MAATTTSEKFVANNQQTMYNHVPATTAATDVAWVDMRDYDGITVMAMASTLSGNGVTAFTINANAESDGGGTDAVVVEHGVASAPVAEGDQLVLECTAEQIREVEILATTGQLRYVTAILTMGNNSSDEAAVTYTRWGPKHPQTGLTSDTVA